ncbi:MAG: hypothetical protein ACXVRV_10625 [Gaiellaceae bacterium]
MTRSRLLVTVLAALTAAATLAGCGGAGASRDAAGTTTGTTTASPPATTTSPADAGAGLAANSCATVPPALDRAILTGVILADARFVKVRATPAATSPRYYFVTATVAGSGTKGLLATWVTRDIGGHKTIYSVDANAALISQYGASTGVSLDLGVDAPASLRSRVCVAGKHATAGLPAPPAGGGAPAGQ